MRFRYKIPINRVVGDKIVKVVISQVINASCEKQAKKKLRKHHDTFIWVGEDSGQN